MWLDTILALGCLVLSLCVILKFKYSFFDKNKIKHVSPTPVLGNLGSFILGKESLFVNLSRLYNTYPDERYIGVFDFITPFIMVRDPELIKEICVKDFDYFVDHRTLVDEEMDPLFGKNMFVLTGQKWRDMRSTLTPAFTTSKIKMMFPMVMDCSCGVVKYYKKVCDTNMQSGLDAVEVEAKDLFSRYTINVIGATAFGIKVDCFEDKTNEFYSLGRDSIEFSGIRLFKFLGYAFIPNFMRFFKINLLPAKVSMFFRRLVRDSMSYRISNNIRNIDVIHLLMDSEKKWTEDELTAQALLFFIAGYETSSSMMAFMVRELAANPDVKNKLQREVDQLYDQSGDNASYENITSMEYMDMVISETLRKWPPAGLTDRVCAKNYSLGDSRHGSNNSYMVKKGQVVWIPINAIHHDPKYWENPESFIPERFSKINRTNIKPFTYLPFGGGPRNCIGSRFALMEVKLMMYQLLRHFEFKLSPRTAKEIILAKKTMNTVAEGGSWISLSPRHQKSACF